MNILILSCGTRNKIVQYFKKAFSDGGRVIATDMSPYAPALYEADSHYIVPRITAPDYLDVIADICRKDDISGVLSLIDPELSLLAQNRELFNSLGVTVIGSDFEQCERAMDKMQMYHWLKRHGYACAESFTDRAAFYQAIASHRLSYPVFVKPVRGSASIAINKACDQETVDFLLDHDENLMIQETMLGQEIGADVYIDLLTGEVVSIFTKKKLLMRAGETDKSISFKDNALFRLIEDFVKESGFRGQIDIDIFKIDDTYYISEVNPRFGGGYPHAYECGVDHMRLIRNNLAGIANPPTIGNYEENIVMMKYNDIGILHLPG